MANKKGFIEHRRHRRYSVGAGVIVSTPSRIGEVINIGLGGLSFRCLDNGELPVPFESAILFGEDDLSVEEVTIKLVGDYTKGPPAGYRQIRKIGAKFGELSIEQKQTLRNFILLHAK